ncbi:MAG: hypothetical protein KIS92_04680 [Planctomycetota bacterium]|nr:hypothetical protein [Planctomycetota bacterium]
MGTSSRELVRQAMALGKPERVPVMCQLAIGHTLLQTGIHPVDYFLSSQAYADGLLKIREIYNFDGVLMHKNGRDPNFMDLVVRIDRDQETPSIYLKDGSRIDCTRDDDPYYRHADGFERPEVETFDPDDPLGWAPESFRRWCEHKGTAVYRTPEAIPAFWFDCIDRVKAAIGETHSVHGEVRSPFDHLLNIVGMEPGLMALLISPEHTRRLLETFADMSTAWAVAQCRRGCDAIKISSPFAGGGFLSPDQYREWIMPYETRIAAAVRAEGKYVYTHTCGAIGDRLDLMAETGIHGIETLDPPPLGTVNLAEAKRLLRDRLFIKGNVDPVNSLLRKDAAGARADIERVYGIGSEGGQYILSTACSVAPPTRRENVKQLTECVYAHAE